MKFCLYYCFQAFSLNSTEDGKVNDYGFMFLPGVDLLSAGSVFGGMSGVFCKDRSLSVLCVCLVKNVICAPRFFFFFYDNALLNVCIYQADCFV